MNYQIPQTRIKIIKQFFKLYPDSNPLSIIIVTYNRLPYLQKCIASIHGATAVPYRILVVDDGSTDGTVKWLQSQEERGKIWKVILNNRTGTARNFNMGISHFSSEWVVIANDDMWFHRWWDVACMGLLSGQTTTGTLTFYDFTNHKVKQEVFGDYAEISGSGLGAAFIRQAAWKQAGAFKLKANQKMGFFAALFCKDVSRHTNFKHLLTIPNWAHHMDLPASALSERDVLQKYIAYRKQAKKGASG